MRQATVNLFADMGVQPATLQAGLHRGDASTDTPPPRPTITSPSPAPPSPPDAPSRSPAPRPTPAAAGRRRRGLDRRRRDLAPRRPAASTGATRSRRRRRARHDPQPRDRRQRQHRSCGIGRASTSTVAATRCPCSLWDDTTDAREPGDDDRHRRSRSARASDATSTARSPAPLLQGRGEHRYPHRAPVDQRRTLLATATFTGESASGWQEVAALAPVAITANTTYIVSYFSPAGYYAFDGDYFSSTASTTRRCTRCRPPAAERRVQLRRRALPDDTFQRRNYWVDVVFETGPDTTPPIDHARVRRHASATERRARHERDGDVQTSRSTARRSRASTFELRDAREHARCRRPSATTPATRTAMLTPDGTAHAVDGVHGDTCTAAPSGVTDAAGNALAADVTWTFTTRGRRRRQRTRRTDPRRRRARRTRSAATSREILRAEGLNAFRVDRHRRGDRGGARRLRRRAPRADAADRGAGDDVHGLA